MFTRIACEMPSYTYPPPAFPNELRWLELTHINQHWRSVALDSPTLWLKLFLCRLKLVPLMLERSQNHNISIKLDFEQFQGKPEVLCNIVQHITHMRELDITNAAESFEEHAATMRTEAPKLERLSLGIRRHYRAAEESVDIPARHLPRRCQPTVPQAVGR